MDLVNEPSSKRGIKYDVFLSYSRGEDTQNSFALRLYSSLREAGVSVLRDKISIELLQSIFEGFEVSVIIFSKHYASSRRCLEELTKIMEFCRAYDQLFIPIFYGMDPCEIYHQQSSFGQALLSVIQRFSLTEDEVLRWWSTFHEARTKHGFVLHNFESRNQSEVIQNIVKRVRYILDTKDSLATYGLVGVSSQVLEMIQMLQEHQSKDVLHVGIWGMSGIGKTTIAEAIFHHIYNAFDTRSFLSGSQEWRNNKHPAPITDTHNQKVLLVLDDVIDLEQLGAIRGSFGIFGEGSIVIITTRNLDVLTYVQLIYPIKLLSDHTSLHLFNRNAFKQKTPKGEYIQLSRKMVAYAEGLPLALAFLGSFMNGRSHKEWESTLMKLNTELPSEIYNKLKLSFDSLKDHEKEIFLSIVLFYVGEDINVVVHKLHCRVYDAFNGINVLLERNLVTIDNKNRLKMLNMLQLMGRQIIRESSQNELRNRGYIYEVFLSFRGEDTRTTFTSHLYSALCNAGITVFKDDAALPRGSHIGMKLLQAIGSSKIAIIIFSKEYAASKWCLEELSLIIEFHKSNDQMVLPVFYNVDPSEVRNQTSGFGEAFKYLIHRISPPTDQVSKWRTALAEAGGIAGFVVLDSRDESENVKAIVEDVCNILDKKDLFVTDHPVAVDERVQEVLAMLQNHQSKDVIMVGIWGMGGIGKTTIAKAIYNEIGRTFDSRSYLPKIRKVWEQRNGKVRLQNQLLSEICMTTKMKINNIESGKVTLKDRLRLKKALVVLDDVDKLGQLNALVGSRDWFKPGSIIIITTRNQSLLFQMDCHTYIMKNLDERESLELFSWHAFKQENPEKDFSNLSRNIVAYSGGLPLALEVLGSYLFARKVEEWEGVLEKLKKIPHNKIQKKLKISFDSLDDLEKEIFLDISCFFIGMDKNDVTLILNGCEFFADNGITTLVERSLVTINEKNELGVHDLLRDMGREIIRKQSQKQLGKRSRLWFYEDALAVLSKDMGTEAIEGLSLQLSQSEKKHFWTEAFKKMKKLRLLHLDNVLLRGDYKDISEDLRWLCWHGFPVKYIPNSFYQPKLVAIDLKYSSLKQVWKEPRLLNTLKILNLSSSFYLVQTPNFSNLPNLEKLILKNCPSLSMIHHSIGLLDKLLLLDLEDCIGLRSLPRSIYRLKCLKTLILSGCVMIDKIEEDIEQMESLTTLIAPTINQVPFSLVRLRSILYLSVCGHEGLSHHVIPSLYEYWISPTNNPLPLIPTHAGIPSSILWDMLNSVHVPSTISTSAIRQQSLALEDGSEMLNSLCATNCLGHLFIQIGKNSQVFRTLSEKISQGLNPRHYNNDCTVPDDNHPYWRSIKGEGASVKFKVPLVNGCDDDNLKGMAICCVHCSSDLGNKEWESCIINLMIINYTKKTTLFYTKDKLNSLEEAERKEIISNLEPDEEVEVMITILGNGFTVKETTVYLIYNESFGDHMEPSPSEATNLIGTKHKCEEEQAHHSIGPRKAMRI